MVKRPASSASAAGAKVAKKSAPAAADASPVDEKFACVLELLGQAEGIPGTCCDMLKAVLPYCLGVGPGERHDFQSTMVAQLEAVARAVESGRSAGIGAIERAVADAEADKAEKAQQAQAALDKIGPIEADISGRAAQLEEARAGVEGAAKALASAREQKSQQEAGDAAALADKAHFETVHSETWQTLKSGMPGRDWRARNKSIAVLVQALRKAGANESLASSLPVALKLAPAARGAFAQRTVEFAEALLGGHVAGLAERVKSSEAAMAEREQAVTTAGEALAAAEKTSAEKSGDLQAAKDVLAGAEKERDDAAAQVKSAEGKLLDLNKALESARSGLAHTQELSGKFRALKEAPAATPADEPTAGAEAPAGEEGETAAA